MVVGRTVLTSTQGQKRRAAAIDIHPRWNPDTFSFDVAVIHLASPISGIAPVQLVTPGVDALERPGTLATVTGWGNTIQQPAGPGYIQAGITSWGIGCGATGFPGVYTRLSNRGVGNFILAVTGGYRSPPRRRPDLLH